MQIQDLSKTKLAETEEGYELSFTDPEWGDQVHVAHLHFDSEPEAAKKGAALLRASYGMQQALKDITIFCTRELAETWGFHPQWDAARAAFELSENTNASTL